MTAEATRNTLKHFLGRTVCFRNMTTLTAFLRRVMGVNRHHAHAVPLRLVFDELAQLPKRPGMQDSALALPNRYPLADALEIFQSDTPFGALRRRNQSFADAVVGIRGKPPFTPTAFLQQTLRRLGVLLLQLGAQATEPRAHIGDVVALHHLAIRGSGDVLNAQIHTNELTGLCGVWLRDINRDQQIEGATAVYQ